MLRPSAAQKALRCESGKGFGVRFFCLFSQRRAGLSDCWLGTLPRLSTRSYLFKPGSPRSREPPLRHQSQRAAGIFCIFRSHSDHASKRDVVLNLALSVSSDHSAQTNTNTSLVADLRSSSVKTLFSITYNCTHAPSAPFFATKAATQRHFREFFC